MSKIVLAIAGALAITAGASAQTSTPEVSCKLMTDAGQKTSVCFIADAAALRAAALAGTGSGDLQINSIRYEPAPGVRASSYFGEDHAAPIAVQIPGAARGDKIAMDLYVRVPGSELSKRKIIVAVN